jgi:hypothetical protein
VHRAAEGVAGMLVGVPEDRTLTLVVVVVRLGVERPSPEQPLGLRGFRALAPDLATRQGSQPWVSPEVSCRMYPLAKWIASGSRDFQPGTVQSVP